MMRVSLNLARHPAENVRRVKMIWGGSLVILLAALATLATFALTGWLQSRGVEQEVASVRAQIAPLAAGQAALQVPLREPKSRAAMAQAQFFNQLINRKSLSWTLLFERLEHIMPPGVELISLRPLQRNGVNAVDLRFASDTLQPAIDFVQALETSPDFSAARVERETESSPPPASIVGRGTPPPPRFQLEVTAAYRGTVGGGSQ